jgi:hypothetical protein
MLYFIWIHVAIWTIITSPVMPFASYRNATMNQFLTSDDPMDTTDLTDLSHIQRIAAIGDSYSAGIGAGKRLGSLSTAFVKDSGMFKQFLILTKRWLTKLYTHVDWACSRYDAAFPNLVNTDYRLGDPAKRKFQFKSCSGAVMDDVLTRQIPKIDSNQQVIMISAGAYI